MAKRLQLQRVLSLAALLGAAFLLLGFRLVDLQVLRHDELQAKAQSYTHREITLEPRRGDILDTKGNPLATSVFVKTVCADPILIGNRQAEVARVVAPILQLNEAEVFKRLFPRPRVNAKGETNQVRSVVLKRKVPVETWEKVQAARNKLSFAVGEKKLPKTQQAFYRDLRAKAIFTERLDDQLRVYPNQSLAAHVLGYVGMIERGANETRVVETAGRDGIEYTLNAKLSGARGWRLTETDSRRREMVARRDQDVEARDGLNVVLTIDSVVQHILETALAEGMEKHTPLSISGIVMRPATGEILAMATLPNFDPNDLGNSTPDARRNRIITDMIEPGSTFKIVTVSGALNDGVVRFGEMFDCENGRFAFAGRVLHDSHGGHGVLSVADIIAKSSNIGAAKIGIKLGSRRLYEYMRDYGFGSRTGIPLPGEIGGLVHPVEKWSKVSIAQIPMGHGVAVTRLQMVLAMSALANDGWLMRPMLVRRLEDRDGLVVAEYHPQRVRQVVSAPTAELLVRALKSAVSPEGTAPKAALEHYTVAGKTGTAQKVVGGIYAPGKYISSFIGFLPADQPELCISIVMDEPKQGYYGGQTAAPVFKQVAERAANYLNIRPDLNDSEPTLPESVTRAPDSKPVKAAAAQTLHNP